eukprot:1175400-Prorocentrum_minimum.AAC.5
MSSLARLTALNNLTLRIGSYSRPYPHIIFLRCHRKEDYNIANDEYTNKELKSLAPIASAVTSLQLLSCNEVTDEGLRLLAPMTNLRQLTLRSDRLTEQIWPCSRPTDCQAFTPRVKIR